MVSDRQKLARKRFRGGHPELFPAVEPTPPKDPNKTKKKKKSLFKRKKTDPSKPTKNGFTKHPLRVPGMKPGDTCFISKAKDHIAKLCPQKAEWGRNKICLLCRQHGHSLKRCPDNSDETVDKKFCYNCGETGHSLAACPYPLEDGGTKYASCFICNERGHLSKHCPKNTCGIYPKGGCCKICESVWHLAKDCPDKAKQGSHLSGGREKTPNPAIAICKIPNSQSNIFRSKKNQIEENSFKFSTMVSGGIENFEDPETHNYLRLPNHDHTISHEDNRLQQLGYKQELSCRLLALENFWINAKEELPDWSTQH